MLPIFASRELPGAAGAVPIALLCAAVAVAAVVWAVSTLRSGRRGTAGGDELFWNTFTASVLLLPAVLIPAIMFPPLGLAVALLAACSAPAAVAALPRVAEVRRRTRAGRALPALVFAHRELLVHWSRYELEPERQIDFPAMSDVRAPATADLIRALGEADRLGATDGAGTPGGAEYARAVLRLQNCLARAESAAGVPAGQRLGVPGSLRTVSQR
jgi:hypothetical protein